MAVFSPLLSPATRSRHVSPASPPADRPLPFGHRSRLRRAGVRRKRPSPVLRHQCGRRDRLCPAAFVLRPVFRPSRPAAMAGQSRTQGLRRLPQQAPSASRRPAPSAPAPHPAGRLLASGQKRTRCLHRSGHALPRGCDASPGTAARLPERKSLQQTPEEDTSKQDSVR